MRQLVTLTYLKMYDTYRHTDDRSLVTFKYLNLLAFKDAPADDFVICGACEEGPAVGICRHAGDGSGVLLKHL